MPHFIESSSSGSSDAESSPKSAFDAQHVVGDAEYAAASFPGYSEAPLSEQLEPIAVVGMGKRFLIAPPGGEVMPLAAQFRQSGTLEKGFPWSIVP